MYTGTGNFSEWIYRFSKRLKRLGSLGLSSMEFHKDIKKASFKILKRFHFGLALLQPDIYLLFRNFQQSFLNTIILTIILKHECWPVWWLVRKPNLYSSYFLSIIIRDTGDYSNKQKEWKVCKRSPDWIRLFKFPSFKKKSYIFCYSKNPTIFIFLIPK